MKQVLGSEVPVEDAGFRHGQGVFETVRVCRGRALWPDWHWEALCEAAGALGLEAPIAFPLDLPPGEEGIWRWFHTPSGIRATWDESPVPRPESCSLRVSGLCHPSLAWSSRYKTLAYLSNLQARTGCGADEALLLNEHGRVATASMANIFWAKGGVLFTPSKECGCREGVVRRWIVEQGGLELRMVEAEVGELLEADEIFVTNSRVDILPVHEFEGRPFPLGGVAAGLRERYWSCLNAAEE